MDRMGSETADKVIRWVLFLLLLVPLLFLAPPLLSFILLFNFRGLIFILFIIAVAVVIPVIGLWQRRSWFYYYVYVLVPIEILIILAGVWFLSLFGDQSYSIASSIFGLLLPLLIYFGIEVALTIILQRRRGIMVTFIMTAVIVVALFVFANYYFNHSNHSPCPLGEYPVTSAGTHFCVPASNSL